MTILNDFIVLDKQFTAEEKLLQESVRHFIEKECIPNINAHFEAATFPKEFIQRTAELGLLGMTLPEAVGGAAADYVAYGLVCQELERGDSALRSFVSVQSSLCMYPIFRFGTEQQQKKYLPLMAKGKLIGCFGLTETNSGSDPSSMQTHAEKVKDGWILNGSKMWITNATIADIAIVWAKTSKGIHGFIVEKSFTGFSTTEIQHKLSLRASITGELIFNNCFVPEANYLPGTEKGLAAALTCLTQARYGIAWGAIGAAEYCFDLALKYTQEREQFGKPLASNQLIQADLVEMATQLINAKLLNLHVGRLREQGSSDPNLVSLIKRNSCRVALMVTRKARNLLGANGITLDYHVIRHMNNLETVFTYEGTDNVHTLILGKKLTGFDGFA